MIMGLTIEERDAIVEAVKEGLRETIDREIKARDRGIRKLSRANTILKKELAQKERLIREWMDAAREADKRIAVLQRYRDKAIDFEEEHRQIMYNMRELFEENVRLKARVNCACAGTETDGEKR